MTKKSKSEEKYMTFEDYQNKAARGKIHGNGDER